MAKKKVVIKKVVKVVEKATEDKNLIKSIMTNGIAAAEVIVKGKE